MQTDYEVFDVVIVGAGPAGLSCARVLGESGKLSILLIEKNAKIGPKICAGGLTTKIKQLGISLENAKPLFSRVTLSFETNSVVVQDNEPFVGTVDRGEFGQFMLKQIPDNVDVRVGLEVQSVDDEFVFTSQGKIKYKYLVGADGSNSLVRRFLKIPNKKFLVAMQYMVKGDFNDLEFHFDAKLFKSGYAWIFPHENLTSIGCGMTAGEGSNNLKRNFDRWLSTRGIKHDGSIQGWTISYDYRGFDFSNKFLIGDAAGFASGLTGEGMYFGIVSGREVAQRILNPNYKCPQIKKILKIKRFHERALRFFAWLSKYKSANSILNKIANLARNRHVAKWMINNFG